MGAASQGYTLLRTSSCGFSQYGDEMQLLNLQHAGRCAVSASLWWLSRPRPRESADRAGARIDQCLHETFDSGDRRGVRPGVQVSVNCLGGEAVHDLTTCSRGGEYPLDTFGQRWFPKLGADPLGHLFAFDYAHRDSPRTLSVKSSETVMVSLFGSRVLAG